MALVCVFLVMADQAFGQQPRSRLLFDSGKEGYPRYRIPSLIVTAKGTLLAICEGRRGGRGLTGEIHLVLKRSADGGKTWAPLEKILSGGTHTLGNPCAVVDRRNGTLWLAYTRSHGKDTEEEIVAGRSREKTGVFLTSSSDDGRTWSPPRDLSKVGRKSDWTWYGTGPGVGTQLANGRLVIPSYHAEARTKIYRSHMLYSDDAGKTWQIGESVGKMCSECHAVQRADGVLVLSARTIQGKPQRTTAESKDGGKTWSAVRLDSLLYDPDCEAHLYKYSGGTWQKTRWLYAHPAGPGRKNLTVRLSYDEGKSWPIAKLLRSGDGQYSSLARLPDGTIGCLYDAWVDGNYRLFYTRFTLDWLTDGRDKLEK
jgi:sialidase-1